ncbi:hypothetical protein GCM10025875_17190 [Litorihabitans aurantiacus]|uniref:Uncharacterized protein n=1 Tax=Litorihabitans aurantiacus TaxID=1930061 RepID=A0AA37XEP7_9MICO|nr:hypothetical protein GCM10025875_17190 [Litorihabitans aurantiacus]
MVALQVGEGDDVEAHPGEPVQRDRVRGDLGREVRDPAVAGDGEQPVQRGRLDRGARGLHALVPDPELHRAHEGRGPQTGAQRGLDEVGRGGLAVRARDADRDEVVRRCAVDHVGQQSRDGARVRVHQDGRAEVGVQLGDQRGAARVGHDGDGARGDGGGRVARAVGGEARDRDEQVARQDGVARDADAGHGDRVGTVGRAVSVGRLGGDEVEPRGEVAQRGRGERFRSEPRQRRSHVGPIYSASGPEPGP